MIEQRHHIERLAVLEAKFQHLEDQMTSMSGKVDEMHKVILQAQGVRSVFLIVLTVIIGSAGALTTWILAKFG